MTNVDYNDGKIHGWNGGVFPVHPKSIVRYWLRGGDVNEASASDIIWEVDPEYDNDLYDIIAFCVVSPYKESKYIWLNEYNDHNVAYISYENARMYAGPTVIRCAVKYQEVIE